jgi:uncharacterized protein (TIGR02145 family)
MTKKYTNFFLSALLALCVITGCDDKDDDAPAITVSSNSVTILATGGEESIEITTNQSEWTATRPELDSWCTLKTNGNALKISASANETITPRSTMITVTAGVGSNAKTQEITVTQKAADPSLEITGTPVHLDAAGTAIELTVTTNTGVWNASRPDGDTWCILSQEGDKLTVSAEAYTVNAERKTTVTVTYGEDASLTPKTFEVTQQGAAPVYAIEIPSDFSTGDVQKVMYQNVKVAEVCREYIRIASSSIDKQMIVIYPVTTEGKTDLTKGFTIPDGGAIVWDIATNTCTYTPGTESALSKVYLAEGDFSSTTTATSPINAMVEAELLTDTRPNDTRFNYKIVKIGTQYWMAENLKAQNYLNGTEIPRITNSTDWNSNTTGAHRLPFADTQSFLTFGAFYNGYAMYNEAGLAPEGWIVPSNTEWDKLKKYIGTNSGQKMKSKLTSYWGGTTAGAGTNITRFDAIAAGFYSSATSDEENGKKATFWSTTKSLNLIVKKQTPCFYYLDSSSKIFVYGNEHDFIFGHSIRCVRK